MEETPLTRVLVILSALKSAASAAALSAPATIAGVTAALALIAAAGAVTARHAFRHLSQHGICFMGFLASFKVILIHHRKQICDVVTILAAEMMAAAVAIAVVVMVAVNVGVEVQLSCCQCLCCRICAAGYAAVEPEDGREITLYRLLDGDICLFSASCMLKSIQFEMMIGAEKDTELLLIPADIYKSVMEQSARYISKMPTD